MSSEQRVYAHYKSLKLVSPLRWVKDYDCAEPHENFEYPHMHGHYETTTSNEVWLRLARVHKMSVRQVKDIVTKMRGRKWD